MTRRPVRIANVSGFYGDRVAAAREMLETADVDVVTGDYLAELTMFLLHKARARDPEAGFAATFLSQMREIMPVCVERGIRVVVNAGGLNPGGLARRLQQIADELFLTPRIAWTDGDDVLQQLPALQVRGEQLRHLDTDVPLADAGVDPITANAYLGAWPLVAALERGADIVVTGRVTDASVVVAPAAWWHGWKRDDWDRLAGAVAAGHVIECGPQATGGNFSFFTEIDDARYPGFPIAEIADDGSVVITKPHDSGGLVSPETVTAQLLYEIQAPAYEGPDVTARFDTIRLESVGSNRVKISGAVGAPPAGRVKIAANYLGGYRNTMTAVLTGLDIDKKAARAEELIFSRLGGRESFDATDVRLLRYDHPDSDVQAEASAHLVITVKDRDRAKVGRGFSSVVMELFLGGYPGFYATTPPTAESAYGVYWPTLIEASAVLPTVHHHDGDEEIIPLLVPDEALRVVRERILGASVQPDTPDDDIPGVQGETVRVPLGRLVGARSGDKGGNANIGVWARDDAVYSWLQEWLTLGRLRALVPEARELDIRRYSLPNLRAVNFVIVGILGEGVASSTRPDAQAKALGEYLRSRLVDVPRSLISPTT